MIYRTRHLVAGRPIQHGDVLYSEGEPFLCTDVDAEYYLGRRWATEHAEQSAEQGSTDQGSPEQPKRRGRPPKAAQSAEAAAEHPSWSLVQTTSNTNPLVQTTNLNPEA